MSKRWDGMGKTSANCSDVSGYALAGNRNLNTNDMLGELSLWDSVSIWSINTQNRLKTTGSKAFGGILGGRGVRLTDTNTMQDSWTPRG